MKKHELFTLANLIEVVEEGLMSDFRGDPPITRIKEQFFKTLMKSRTMLYAYLWKILNESVEFLGELGDKDDPDLKEIGMREMRKELLQLIHQFIFQSSEAFLMEGAALSEGFCLTGCKSKVCPLIKKYKPEQYDEELAEKKRKEALERGPPQTKISVISVGMGVPKDVPDEVKEMIIQSLKRNLPFDIDEDLIREKLKQGTFSINMGDIRKQGKSRTLAELLGANEEKIKEWMKSQIGKKEGVDPFDFGGEEK